MTSPISIRLSNSEIKVHRLFLCFPCLFVLLLFFFPLHYSFLYLRGGGGGGRGGGLMMIHDGYWLYEKTTLPCHIITFTLSVFY